MINPSKERPDFVDKVDPQRGILAMSETGHVQKLTLPGLFCAFLLLGGPGAKDSYATGLLDTASPRLLAESILAQSDETSDGAAAETEPEPDAGLDEGDVPFSELNEALSAARSRLAELTKAADIAKVAGELREKLQQSEAENRQLKSVLSQLQTDNSDLLSGKQAAERQLTAFEEAMQEASAEARRLDEELVSMRWQNSQLSTNLERAEAVASENGEELAAVRKDLGARVESLTAAADVSAGEITRLQRELDTAREQVLIAERQEAQAAAELAELRQTTEETTADSARLARDLDSTITELAKARTDLATIQRAHEDAKVALVTAEGETDVLREQLAGVRSEADKLRGQLETAENDIDTVRTLNAGLEQQVALLKTAAGEATDAARQNLLAVEDQINEINAAFASVSDEELLPGAGGPVVEEGNEAASAAGETAARASSDNGWVPRPSPPRADNRQGLIAVAVSDEAQVSTPASSPLAGTVSQPPSQVDAEAPPVPGARPATNVASLTPELPSDQRQDAEALLSKLKAEKSSRGLSMTVPGELLFAVNSEKIEPAAFDALASVAKLVDIYDESPVLIVGHTDAVGDAGYNQQLSERRAALVKKYFVENFEIDASRLQIEGKGEQDPITSNATADGRNANRRVEVVILE